jgi:hypothetical protein
MSLNPGGPGDVMRRQIDLLVNTGQGPAAVADLRREVLLLNHALHDAAIEYTRTGDINAYLNTTRGLNQEVARAQQLMQSLNSTTGATPQSMRAASRALLEFSRGFEDFITAGFIGALNNIPTMVYNIGQSMQLSTTQITAWTAVISLAGTAAYAAYRNWDEFLKLLDMPVVKTAHERMDQLSRATHKTVDEQRELNKLKKEFEAIEQMGRDRSREERATEHAVQSAFEELGRQGGLTGRERTLRGIVGVRQALGIAAQESQAEREAREQRELALRQAPTEFVAESIRARMKLEQDEVRKRIADEENQYAVRLIEQSKLGGEHLATLTKMVREHPGAFPKGLLAGLEGATPEARAAATREKTAREFERQQVEAEAREAEADDRRAADQQFRDQEAATERHLRLKKQRQRQAAQEAKRAAAEGRKEETAEQREAKTLATRFEPAFGGRARQALEVNRARLEQMRGMPREMYELQQDLDRMAGVEPVRGEREAMQQVAREIAETMRRARARDEQGRIMTAEQRARTATEIVRKAALDAEQRFMNMQMQHAGVANMMGISAQNQSAIAANEAAMTDLIDSGLRQLNQAQHRIQQVERRINPGRLQGGRLH